MKANVGTGDKIFRVIVGLGIIGAGVYFQSWWG
ncbi:MAG: YgaP-like transmembrane domain [Pseudomonadota bacterium]